MLGSHLSGHTVTYGLKCIPIARICCKVKKSCKDTCFVCKKKSIMFHVDLLLKSSKSEPLLMFQECTKNTQTSRSSH